MHCKNEAKLHVTFVTKSNPKQVNPVYLDAKGETASENLDLTQPSHLSASCHGVLTSEYDWTYFRLFLKL